MKGTSAALTILVLIVIAGATFADGHESTIVDIVVASAAAEAAEFTTLLAAVDAADPAILEALGEEAFNAILTEEGTPRLNEILRYHVLPGLVPSADVVVGLLSVEAGAMGPVSFPVVTLGGQALDIAGIVAEDGLDLAAGITIAEANLVLGMVDIDASNGVIHVIDAVIVPELHTIADIVVESAGAENPEFTTLLSAVSAAAPALLDALADPGAELTVFAPTDTAFAAVAVLEDIVADTRLLTAILQYHVFPGAVYSFQIGDLADDMGQAAIAMASGSEATLSVSDTGVMVDSANIVLELVDIEASTGVIRAIDAVILPRS